VNAVELFAESYWEWRSAPVRFSVQYKGGKLWGAPKATLSLSRPLGEDLIITMEPGDNLMPMRWTFAHSMNGLPTSWNCEEVRTIGKATFTPDGTLQVYLATNQFSNGTGWELVDSIGADDFKTYVIPGEARP